MQSAHILLIVLIMKFAQIVYKKVPGVLIRYVGAHGDRRRLTMSVKRTLE